MCPVPRAGPADFANQTRQLSRWSTSRIFESPRCMFGSDWPVCRLAASYTQVVELATAALATLSSTQRHDVLYGSAIRAYKLKLPDAYIGD